MKIIGILGIMVLLFAIINNSNGYAQTTTTATTTSTTMSNTEDKNEVVLKNHKIQDDELIGQLQNNATYQANFVRIIATYFDQNGDMIGVDATYPEPYILKPNTEVPFEMSFGEGIVNEIASYDLTITWRTDDGSNYSKVYEFTNNNNNNNINKQIQ